MEDDNRSGGEPHDVEMKRDKALARYDAHPGIAVIVLAVAACLFIVVAYQFASDRSQDAAFPKHNAQAVRNKNPLIGLSVLSSDGKKIGTVERVDGEPDGKISAINIAMGDFLGFGARFVAIPEDKFRRIGDSVRIGNTADAARKLPGVNAH